MPIILPRGLASAEPLRREGIDVLHKAPWGVAPLRIGLLNLMPDKARTEMQFARLLGGTRRHVELVLAVPASHRRQDGGEMPHYARWGGADLPNQLHGLIVTGAPLEHLPFEQVTYWRELARLCERAASDVGSTLYICWAAFAALHLFHGVRMRALPEKISGVFEQHVMEPSEALTARLGETFPCPVSRHAEVAARDVPWQRGLTCLAQSAASGLCLIADRPHNAAYMFNHLEYDADTLKHEHLRDRARQAGVPVPKNYWPDDDVSQAPPLVWRRPAEKLFANWLAILAARRHQAPACLGRTAA